MDNFIFKELKPFIFFSAAFVLSISLGFFGGVAESLGLRFLLFFAPSDLMLPVVAFAGMSGFFVIFATMVWILASNHQFIEFVTKALPNPKYQVISFWIFFVIGIAAVFFLGFLESRLVNFVYSSLIGFALFVTAIHAYRALNTFSPTLLLFGCGLLLISGNSLGHLMRSGNIFPECNIDTKDGYISRAIVIRADKEKTAYLLGNRLTILNNEVVKQIRCDRS